MDDLSEKLSALLSDPDGMAKIKDMAQNILGGAPQEKSLSTTGDVDVGAIAGMLKLLKQNNKDDSRIQLLMALRPNLSTEKQGKVDTAIKILKLTELAPLLKDAGIFDF